MSLTFDPPNAVPYWSAPEITPALPDKSSIILPTVLGCKRQSLRMLRGSMSQMMIVGWSMSLIWIVGQTRGSSTNMSHDRVVMLACDLLLSKRDVMLLTELGYRQAYRPSGTHILEGKPCGFMMISGTIP